MGLCIHPENFAQSIESKTYRNLGAVVYRVLGLLTTYPIGKAFIGS